MKIISILSIILGSLFANAQAINLQYFQNKNFDAIGNYCGLHLEVSGSRLIMTRIIPPKLGANASCDYYRPCNGKSDLLTCNETGDCKDKNGELVLILLEDGNIFNVIDRTKSVVSDESRYYYCK